MVDEQQFRWYIVQAYSGSEKKVAEAIKDQAERKNIIDQFEQIIVPAEGITEIRRGQKINTERKLYPGYVLVKMKMNDETWHLVKNIDKVSGFLGGGSKPMPISEAEIKRTFDLIEEGITTNKHAITFEVGESVKINEGPFESFVGVVEEVDLEKSRLKVSVSIFGRSTPVELEYSQVAKV